jgi:hypothetical protein
VSRETLGREIPFVLPDAREATLDRVPSREASTWRVGDRVHRLQPHDEDEGPIGADELDMALEPRKVDDTRAHEGIDDGVPSDHDLVVRRVDRELFGPQPFQRWDITPQGCDPFLVVERPHVLCVRAAMLCHGNHPQRHAEQQKEC